MRFEDNGEITTLDLHGVRVHEATTLILKATRLSWSYGRKTLKIIHGTSTSDPDYRNRTIKYTLYELIEEGELDDWIADELYSDSFCVLILDSIGRINKRERISPFMIF